MKKTKFTIEYQLKTSSIQVLWNSISTSLGLSEWFADKVKNKDENFTFIWENFQQNASLLSKKASSYIRFQWEEDKGTENYFELKITTLEVTGGLALIVTDFSEEDEKEDMILLWNKQIEVLRRKMGM
jgi:hypothetical protein